jgi:aquaporin NIP
MHFQAFILEIIGSFMYMYMIFALVVDKRAPKHIYGIAIGGTLGVSVLSFGTISGGCLNPARVLGPAILSLELGQLWLYIAAPIAGCVSAAFIYNFLLLKTDTNLEEVEHAKDDDEEEEDGQELKD